jgi:hypothetical protein
LEKKCGSVRDRLNVPDRHGISCYHPDIAVNDDDDARGLPSLFVHQVRT